MFRSTFLCLLAATQLALAAPPSPFRKSADRDALRKALKSVIETSPLQSARVSFQVRSLDDGAVVFGRDADELLNPASNVKLFTAATALMRLGTEFRFETEFLTDGELKEGKAKVLYVRGKGDPTLTTERLYGIVSDLQHAGLKEVSQELVVDDSYFDGDRTPPGYDQEHGDKAYLAPTGALSLNWNTVGVFLRPGDTIGAKATVELDPPSDFFTLDESVVTGTRLQRRYTVSSSLDKDRVRQHIEAKGVVPLDKGAWSTWKKVEQPSLYFAYTLKAMLQQRGIKVKGRIRADRVPPQAKPLVVAQSDTLDLVLKKLNKLSQNFVAEQLIKTLGAEGRGAPGSTQKGIEVVEDFLAKQVGLPRGTYVMKNGSGLNDTNRFSADQVTKLLLAMWAHFPTAPEYLSALGIAGKDGTLRFRFEGSDAVGRLRAKTGTLENVSALAGYVESVGGERFVFAVMVNDFPGRASTVVQYVDALGAAVAAMGSERGPQAAVALLTQPPQVVGSAQELLTRLKTYAAVAQKGDARNAPFLRTAWRSEKDPALRAIIADALYQSDPREPSAARMLLDSALPTDEVWGRVRTAARDAKLDVPLLTSLVELGASGNVDAAARLLEFVVASASDELTAALLAEALAVVAHDAPTELLVALQSVPGGTRDAATDALVKGMVKAAQPDAPLWGALRSAQGSQDARFVEFTRALETALSQKIAAAHAAPAPEVPVEVPPKPAPPEKSPSVPGG